jgi:cytoplasmic iron level regulating protein YaaA (DUF328/UPF0246 family)
MLFMLSPAKTLDYATPKADLPHCRPDYGVLRRPDRMQPCRLERVTALGPARILHPFRGTRIFKFLNRRLAPYQTLAVVNLTSHEYAKTVDRQALKAPLVDCVFEEWIGGGCRIISFRGKKARGQMAPYAIGKRVVRPLPRRIDQ